MAGSGRLGEPILLVQADGAGANGVVIFQLLGDNRELFFPVQRAAHIWRQRSAAGRAPITGADDSPRLWCPPNPFRYSRKPDKTVFRPCDRLTGAFVYGAFSAIYLLKVSSKQNTINSRFREHCLFFWVNAAPERGKRLPRDSHACPCRRILLR